MGERLVVDFRNLVWTSDCGYWVIFVYIFLFWLLLQRLKRYKKMLTRMDQIDSDFTGNRGNSQLSLAWHGMAAKLSGMHLHFVTTEGIQQATGLNCVF
jgi:hypothetical protein